MGTAASVPTDPNAGSSARESDTKAIARPAAVSAKEENKGSQIVASPSRAEDFLVDDTIDAAIANGKLKRMALGGYKDKDRDYDSTLATIEFNKAQQVAWSLPKTSPEKVSSSAREAPSPSMDVKHDSSLSSMKPYLTASRNAALEASPVQPNGKGGPPSQLTSPNNNNYARPTPQQQMAPRQGPPPGVAVRPFHTTFSGHDLSNRPPAGSSSDDPSYMSPSKQNFPPQQLSMTTPVKGAIMTPMMMTPNGAAASGPSNGLPVRPFFPSGSNSMMQTAPSSSSKMPVMMAIPPNARAGSAPVAMQMGNNNNNSNINTFNGGPGFGLGMPPTGMMVPGMMMAPNMVPGAPNMMSAGPSSVNNNIGSMGVNNIPAGMMPMVMGGPRGIPVAGGAGNNNAAPPPTTAAPLPVVKETKDVKRNKAQLPSNLTHATPTTGDWLNKRYIVNNYILLDMLGAGSYGEVRLCKDRTTERLFAIKIISKDFLKKRKNGKSSETYFEDIKREIAIMKKLLHPNVLRLFEVLDDPKVNKMYLVLEYMKKGDLINILKKRNDGDGSGNSSNNSNDFVPLSDLEVWQIFRQLVQGIKYLHFQNIVHGDIKPQNLLLGDDGIVKIADFGISQMLSGSGQKLADAAGTPAFMAPELCEGKGEFSGQLADVWAIGATVFMLRFGNPPFVAKSIINLYHKICHDPLVFPPSTIPLDPGLQNILEGMLIKDPNRRLTIQQIIAHPWFVHRPAITSPPVAVATTGPPKETANSKASSSRPSTSNSNSNNSNTSSAATGSKSSSSASNNNNNGSFQPPPGYDDAADEAMKGPVHFKTLQHDEVFMSIGGISAHEEDTESHHPSHHHHQGTNAPGAFDSAIQDVIEEGDDEDDEDEEIDVDDDDEEESSKKKRETKVKKVKASDVLMGRAREYAESKAAEVPSVDAKESKTQPRSEPAVKSTAQLPTKADAKGADVDDNNVMGTNWGADVFQIVADERRGKGNDDDDDEDDLVDDYDSDDSSLDDRNREENMDSFDQSKVHLTTNGSKGTKAHQKQNTGAAGGMNGRKESRSEMSEEEEARRSKRFMKKITKKSTENMLAGNFNSSQKGTQSGKLAINPSMVNSASLGSYPDVPSASLGGSKSSLQLGLFQPVPATAGGTWNQRGGALQSHLSSTSSHGGSTNTSNNGSPNIKPGGRSSRGPVSSSNGRTYSTNSNFDCDEDETVPLTAEEFTQMMDTLTQQQQEHQHPPHNHHAMSSSGSNSLHNDSLNKITTSTNTAGHGNGKVPSVKAPGGGSSTASASGSASARDTEIESELPSGPLAMDRIVAPYGNVKITVSGAFHAEQGVRPTQEDRCVLLPNVASMGSLQQRTDISPGVRDQLSMMSLCAIFDGHDGWRSSQHLSQCLPTMLVLHDHFLDPKHLSNALIDTCCTIDAQLCDILREEEDNSGSTGVIAVYDGRKKVLTVAGVGDSLCVLSRNGRAVGMNTMHRLDNASERERVKHAGGTIINNRVNGVLAVSRSFGDTPFKTLALPHTNAISSASSSVSDNHHKASTSAGQSGSSINSTTSHPPATTSNPTNTQGNSNNTSKPAPGFHKAKIPLHRLVNESLVTAVPEIYSEVITPQTEFALLATDGLWDVLSPQAAVSFARGQLARHADLQRAAREMALEALQRGSIDNVTVVLLAFHTTGTTSASASTATTASAVQKGGK